jgi:hypothetical protein
MIVAQGQPEIRLSGVAKFVLLLVRVGCAACRAACGSRSLGVSCAACRTASGSRLVSRVSGSAGCAGKSSYIL